ncbi:uncharacterized protein LOC132549836 [Ylistrum balloti]|uniref:uncharacterized protein LOC132549836 n=1 Tax=Ylistrum balloti TaxID=509963 RepID=UPI002905CB11|nr:uncharacterized protein LOC132549836 [Ylistrum balloti]
MAFCTTYHSILDHNLKNIYSGSIDGRILRSPSKLPVIQPQRHACSAASRRRNQDMEYNHEYQVYMPRAPAFDVMSKESIAKMVDRMHRPKTSHDFTDDTKSEHATSGLSLNRSMTSLSATEIKNCSERLANQQTVSTEVRRCLTGCIRTRSATPDIRSSCPRMTKSISQRYYPRAYKHWYASNST